MPRQINVFVLHRQRATGFPAALAPANHSTPRAFRRSAIPAFDSLHALTAIRRADADISLRERRLRSQSSTSGHGISSSRSFILLACFPLDKLAVLPGGRLLGNRIERGEWQAFVCAGHRASPAFPQWAGRRGVAGTRVCFAKFWKSRSSNSFPMFTGSMVARKQCQQLRWI